MRLLFFLLLTYAMACNSRNSKGISQLNKADTIVTHDTVFMNPFDWQESFGLTHDPEQDSVWGKPIKYYTDKKNCSPIAIDFYLGQFRPTDNNTTTALLSLVTTDDDSLRPFYRWCLDKTIQIQDGALAESTGVPARQYAERFPKEFFEYMKVDTTNNKYNDWVNSISYSGFYDQDDYRNETAIRKRMIITMKRNCKDCNGELMKGIEKFAFDCFH